MDSIYSSWSRGGGEGKSHDSRVVVKSGSELIHGKFGIFLDSKIGSASELEIYLDNLKSFFQHIQEPELVGNLYFMDDSEPEFRDWIRSGLEKRVEAGLPGSRIVEISGNESVYSAVNKAWSLIREEYAVRIHSDFRVIRDLPLKTIHQAFLRYSDVYLIYLRVRGLFGFNDEQQGLKKEYPWYQEYPDNFQETWFCRNREGQVFSLPQKLYEKQKAKQLPQDKWGTELIPRYIDPRNTLWTPRLPAMFLESYPSHESFAGGGTVVRVAAVLPWLPIPKRYAKRPPAECFETYFWETDLDAKYYTGYLNLQAFTIGWRDPKRPLQNYPPKYWPAFLERNSTPVVFSGPDSAWHVSKPEFSKLYHKLAFTACRRRLKQKYEFLRDQYLAARSRIWRTIAARGHSRECPQQD